MVGMLKSVGVVLSMFCICTFVFYWVHVMFCARWHFKNWSVDERIGWYITCVATFIACWVICYRCGWT